MIELTDATIDRVEKLTGTIYADSDRYYYADLRCVIAELRRLRAAVEAVRALPRYGYDKVGKVHIVDEDDRWLNRDDVLAALEATDGD